MDNPEYVAELLACFLDAEVRRAETLVEVFEQLPEDERDAVRTFHECGLLLRYLAAGSFDILERLERQEDELRLLRLKYHEQGVMHRADAEAALAQNHDLQRLCEDDEKHQRTIQRQLQEISDLQSDVSRLR